MYRDEDGYYVVKEAFHKPTNPFERLKLAKDPMKDTVHLAYLEEMAKASAEDFEGMDEAADPDDVDHGMKYAACSTAARTTTAVHDAPQAAQRGDHPGADAVPSPPSSTRAARTDAPTSPHARTSSSAASS